MRLCLKCSLLFAILIGLSSALAPPSPTGSDSIVVFAPHPDDEVIGCAGIMMQALARGVRVKVVLITSGDGFDAAAAGVTHKPVDHLGPDDFFALSRLRQAESRSALEILGGKADDLIVLGYPDGDLGNLYDSTDDKVIRQQFTKKNETYALIQKDYHTSMHGKPAPYKRSSVLGDLVELLTTLQPTEIYVTDETDGHIDHRAAFWFVRDAARQVGYKGAFYTYLVHGLPAWPFPPGVTPSRPFESRKVESEVAPRGLPWPPPRRDPLTPEQAQRKLKSIQAHSIPVVMHGSDRHLRTSRERSLIVERVKAGLQHARSHGKVLGRPPLRRLMSREIGQLRSERINAKSPFRILAKKFGVSVLTAHTLCARHVQRGSSGKARR